MVQKLNLVKQLNRVSLGKGYFYNILDNYILIFLDSSVAVIPIILVRPNVTRHNQSVKDMKKFIQIDSVLYTIFCMAIFLESIDTRVRYRFFECVVQVNFQDSKKA